MRWFENFSDYYPGFYLEFCILSRLRESEACLESCLGKGFLEPSVAAREAFGIIWKSRNRQRGEMYWHCPSCLTKS